VNVSYDIEPIGYVECRSYIPVNEERLFTTYKEAEEYDPSVYNWLNDFDIDDDGAIC
jgi:hypothetical protein